MKNIMNFIKKNKKIICILLLVFFYFSFAVTITYDGAMYVYLADIMKGTYPWVNWGIVRGFSFPLLIFLSDLLFGKTAVGLTMLTFVFYVIMLYYLNKILKIMFNSKSKFDKIIRIILLLAIIINPLVFGYYHLLLTEFVALTVSLVFCYLSYIWMNESKFDSKKSIIITIIYWVFLVFMWFIKQPYLSAVLYPFIIGGIISICKNHKLENVLTKIFTIILGFVILGLSINIWYSFLNTKDINTSSAVENNLGNNFIGGIDYYKTITDENAYLTTSINDNKYLSDDDKETLLNDNGSYVIISILDKDKNIIDEQLLPATNRVPSKTTSLKFLGSELLKHPYYIFESYFAGYMGMSDLYVIEFPNNDSSFINTRVFNINHVLENYYLASILYEDRGNIQSSPANRVQDIEDYYQVQHVPYLIQKPMYYLSKVNFYFYKLCMVLLPFSLIGSIVFLFVTKNKKLKEKNYIVLILLGYSFLHIMGHIVLGATLDRYAAPTIITTILGIVFTIYLYIVNFKDNKLHKKAIK